MVDRPAQDTTTYNIVLCEGGFSWSEIDRCGVPVGLSRMMRESVKGEVGVGTTTQGTVKGSENDACTNKA